MALSIIVLALSKISITINLNLFELRELDRRRVGAEGRARGHVEDLVDAHEVVLGGVDGLVQTQRHVFLLNKEIMIKQI